MIGFLLFFLLLLHFCESEMKSPVIIEQPQDIIAELDKPMAIHCRAESPSLDDLQIDWYKDGRLVTTDPHARIITEFMALHVINAMPQDAGVYYCLAKNSHGQTQSRKARIQFLKLDKDFAVSPMSTSVSVGARVRLRCQPPHGLPTPVVYWTKDGRNLSMPLDHYDLLLPSVQPTDFGSYRCVASNGLLRQSSIAHLTEFHRPKLSIQPSSSRIDLERGQSIDLQCQIDNDQYEIEWHFRTEIRRESRLNISAIEFEQSGLYTCLARFGKHVFSEGVFLAVHDRQISENVERIFSQSNVTVFIGQSAVIDCQLPFRVGEKISWTIRNHTDIKFDYIDQNQYRLRINRIREFDQNLLFECSYADQNKISEGLIRLIAERMKPPPIIGHVPNNQTVPIGVDVTFFCQPIDENVNVQWWFIPSHRPNRMAKLESNRKYQIEANHDLVVRHVDKNDAGKYKCISTNTNNDQTTWTAHLRVEDARSSTVFHRVERKDLPSAPSKPLSSSSNNHSIELTWNMSFIDGVLDYLIEYYEVNSSHPNLEWKRLTTTRQTSQLMINQFQSDIVYQFLVRARNAFGYGPPSPLSEYIETKKPSHLPEHLVYLHSPVDIQETSVTIKWNVLQTNHSIDRFSVYIVRGKQGNDRIETLPNTLTIYTINNLRANSDYSIYLVPMLDRVGRSSNTISFRTLEGVPLSSPTDVRVQLTSTTSLSVQWNLPLENETNGQIIAYKVNCLGTNESNSIRLINISSDAKGLYIKNLVENIEYCLSIAARTRIGFGPYSQPICVTMNEKYLPKIHHSFQDRLREVIAQPWFLSIIVLSTILLSCAFSYIIWLCFHHLTRQYHHHRIKFNNSSSSSSNQSVELPVQKTLSNGKRYDLITDVPPLPSSSTALWMDSLPSGIRLQCCTATAASTGSNSDHYSMTIQKNPINALLHESRQQQQQLNPYATTGIFHHSSSSPRPNYPETVPSSAEQQQQPIKSSTSSVQYQPPWLDHYSSSSLQYRSQSRTPHHPCMHCTSPTHPQTPSLIRTTIRSPPTQHRENSSTGKRSLVNNNETTQAMNSSPLVKQQSSNPMMMNSFGGETLTTSWASSIDANNHENLSSSSSIDSNNQKEAILEQNHSSSEGSIFSDSDNPLQEEANPARFERGPSFFSPSV